MLVWWAAYLAGLAVYVQQLRKAACNTVQQELMWKWAQELEMLNNGITARAACSKRDRIT